MRDHSYEMLQARYDRLEKDTSFEDWRVLSQDVLTALVAQQGLVIALQRQALDVYRGAGAERTELRAQADAAFMAVQRLHQLRRKVHALLAQKRSVAANEGRNALGRVA